MACYNMWSILIHYRGSSSSFAMSKHVPTNSSKLSVLRRSSAAHFSVFFGSEWAFDRNCIVKLLLWLLTRLMTQNMKHSTVTCLSTKLFIQNHRIIATANNGNFNVHQCRRLLYYYDVTNLNFLASFFIVHWDRTKLLISFQYVTVLL